jgi:hypothetical protein
MKYLILAFSIGLLGSNISGCKTNEVVVSSPETSNSFSEPVVSVAPELLASIQRTACYGQCPMYKATFMDNGEVKYVGKRFVDKIGTYSGLIPEAQIIEIKSIIKEYDYFSLDSLYPTPISDFPSCITEARLNGVSKRIVDRRNPPENLKSFERFLDAVLKTLELTKVSDETNYD